MQLLRPTLTEPGEVPSLDLTALATASRELAVAEDVLARAYAWPTDAPGIVVRANMVTSLDGGATVDGRAGGLGTAIDQRMIALLRDMSDVVLVGAGTVIAEGYPGARSFARRRDRRARWGLPDVPPWAIVATRSLPADLSAVIDSARPAIVICPDGVWQPPGVEVISTGRELDLSAALKSLAERGYRRVLCEGGPRVLGQLVNHDLLDELCLTMSPTLLGTGVTVPLLGGSAVDTVMRWELATLLVDGDHLFTRYRRQR